jgi:hypothetical protein
LKYPILRLIASPLEVEVEENRGYEEERTKNKVLRTLNFINYKDEKETIEGRDSKWHIDA